MKSRLENLTLYKFDAPYQSDVGVVLVTFTNGGFFGDRFRLTQIVGTGRGSRAGLSTAFAVDVNFLHRGDPNVTNQIFDYIVSNFSFKDLEIVPPACPVLVFHFHVRDSVRVYPQVNVISCILDILRIEDTILDVDDAISRLVPIVPPMSEIVDCHTSSELCCSLCGIGYPKEDEIVHKTKCNHFFHGTCISRYLSQTPQCPVCSMDLMPVDIRTLLFL